MAKCKNCLHYEACSTFSKIINAAAGVEKGCEHFKDRSKVVEVVHGRWEPHPMVPGYVRCSACRDCITYDEWPDGQKWKYCPNCGAKMDK